MSSPVLRIEIITADTALLSDLRAEQIKGLRFTTRRFTCDSPDWIPPVENVLRLIIEGSIAVETNLLAAWLYERFKAKPPENVIVNDVLIEPARVSIVINNYTQNIQVTNIQNE